MQGSGQMSVAGNLSSSAYLRSNRKRGSNLIFDSYSPFLCRALYQRQHATPNSYILAVGASYLSQQMLAEVLGCMQDLGMEHLRYFLAVLDECCSCMCKQQKSPAILVTGQHRKMVCGS